MAIIRKRSHAILRSENGNETIYIVNFNPNHIGQYLETIYELKDFDYECEEDECQEECACEAEEVEHSLMAAEDHDVGETEEVAAPAPVVERDTTRETYFLAGTIGSLMGMYVLIFFMWLGSLSRHSGFVSRSDEL